jgi:uncharacterized protein YkwD
MMTRLSKVCSAVVLAAASLLASSVRAQEALPDFTQRVVDLVNAERASAGLPALRVSWILTQTAQGHAEDQLARDYLAHNSPEGVTPRDRILAAGYDPDSWTGENIYNAWGNEEIVQPEAAMQWWMNSSGHRANILKPEYTEIGVGVAWRGSDGMHVYVQNFGTGGG